MRELRAANVRSKQWVTRSGQERGGTPFSCGALYYLLQNRIYLGEIVHRGLRHSGQHDAIVAQALFDDVQQALAANRQKRRAKPGRKDTCVLVGILFDSGGNSLTTSFSYGRGGRLYRYYVVGSLDPSRAVAPALRIPATPLERLVLSAVGRLFDAPLSSDELLARIVRVEVQGRSIQIELRPERLLEPHERIESAMARLEDRLEAGRLVGCAPNIRVIIDRQAVFRGGNASPSVSRQPDLSNGSELLRSAHLLLEKHSMSPTRPDVHCDASAPAFQRQRHIMALGLLSPAIQKSILQGRRELSPSAVCSLPLAWIDQVA